MRKLLTTFVCVWFTLAVWAGDGIYEKLQQIPQISEIQKLDVKPFQEYYQFWFEQPVDHSDPAKGTFRQRVLLGHKQSDAPVIVELEGYNIWSSEEGELANILKGNQLTIEHRFFDQSVPEGGIPWENLTIKQAADDQHEIIKVLYRGANILILDEPTAVLTPQETRRLFDVLRRMREDGKSIIIITHKHHEVLEISDRVVILRKGKNVGNVATKDATEQSLTEMMVGEKIDLHIERTAPKDPQERLRVEHLTVRNKEGSHVLEDVNFTANGGEILGIAGISGCGQKELLEAIAGLQASEKGSSIVYQPADGQAVNLVGKSPKAIRSLGIALSFVPEDRLGMGLVGNMDIVDNMMLRSYKRGHTAFLERKRPKDLAENIIKSLEIVTPDANTPVRRLSGGNVQKVLVGREIAQHPTVLMVAYPVRGLDINSSYMIYNLLQKQKESGVSVIFVGEDLDVLVELCDRIMVLNSGRITGIVDGPSATKEELGILMTKRVKEEGETHA